jgi:hypothetical protein
VFKFTFRSVLTINEKGSSMFKQMMLFVQLCAVENIISGIKSAAPPFVSSPQLLVSNFLDSSTMAEPFSQDNIKSFVVAVLLSSKLSAYKKNSVPVEHVMVYFTLTSNIEQV